MTRRRFGLVVGCVALVVTVWIVALLWRRAPAAGDSSVAEHPPACTLLTSDDVRQVFGATSSEGQDVPGDERDSCFWELAGVRYDPDRGEFVGVRLDFLSVADYESYGAEVGDTGSGDEVTRIEVGPTRGVLWSGGEQRRVMVRSGRHVLQHYASGRPTGTWPVDAEIDLLRRALSRLA